MRSRGNLPPDLTISTKGVPEASKAFYQRRRLQEYILNFDHPDGKHKAQIFQDVLGIAAADWRYLGDQLVHGLPMAEIVNARVNRDGTMQFHVHIPVRGKNGRTVPVLSAWLIRPSSVPELVTAYPSPREAFIGDPDSFPIPRIVPGFNPSLGKKRLELFEVAHITGLDASSLMVPRPALFGDQVVT
jgi:hypothetical protein